MTPETLLEFEQAHPHPGSDKNETIRRMLGVTEIRYYVLLGRAAASVEGIAAYPVTARMVRERAERGAVKRARRTAA